MNFLSVCENPDILRVIYFLKIIIETLFVIIPIVLLVLIIVDFCKSMFSAENDKNAKANTKNIINRIIFTILLFFVPTIVSVSMNLISESGIKFGKEYTTCLTNANKETINKYQKIQDAMEEAEKQKNKNQ